MAIYVIGDVHGCLPELNALLAAIAFRPKRDRLWFVGDLVNRGPDSLGVLRLVRGLGKRAVVVMGNHEGRVIAALSGGGAHPVAQALRAAPDGAELETWLRALPLLHYDQSLGVGMVHAGLSPTWTLAEAGRLASAVSQILQDTHASQAFFQEWEGTLLDEEPSPTEPIHRLRFAFALMTRLRLCTPAGVPLWPNHPLVAGLANPYAFVPASGQAAPDFPFRPWFELRPRSENVRFVYGHWAAAGLTLNHNTWGLDSGCVYGGKLTAMCLDHPERPVTQVVCPAYVVPEAF
ncbi:MAG: symmetrical bis(5'-nucleosyl)-tetraphosphatase [Magnetococcales bacterium]|nr:symmetrical bis(5'-nucleosyl)-tetraphosphatase [Magnetococcales bacterium]